MFRANPYGSERQAIFTQQVINFSVWFERKI